MTRMKISSEQLVCKACRMDVTRVLEGENYLPHWVKTLLLSATQLKEECCVINCTDIALHNNNLGNEISLATSFTSASLACKVET